MHGARDTRCCSAMPPSLFSPTAGKGATPTMGMAMAVVLADSLADGSGRIVAAFAAEEARPRPWADAARRMARRNVRLLTATNRFQLLAHEAVLLLAARPFLAPVVKRLLKRDGERL